MPGKTCLTLSKSDPPLSSLSLNDFCMLLISNFWRVVTNLNPSGIVFNLGQHTISKWQSLGMAPSSTLHSFSWNNLERKRDWSTGNPLSEQTIFFPSKASYRRLRIFKLGNFSNIAIWSSSSLVLNKVNLARFWENWWASGSFFFIELNIFSFSVSTF